MYILYVNWHGYNKHIDIRNSRALHLQLVFLALCPTLSFLFKISHLISEHVRYAVNHRKVLVLLMYCMLQVFVERRAYITNTWHWLCIVLLVLGVPDVVLSFVLPMFYDTTTSVIFYTLLVFIILRSLRIFRLLEVSEDKKSDHHFSANSFGLIHTKLDRIWLHLWVNAWLNNSSMFWLAVTKCYMLQSIWARKFPVDF